MLLKLRAFPLLDARKVAYLSITQINVTYRFTPNGVSVMWLPRLLAGGNKNNNKIINTANKSKMCLN